MALFVQVNDDQNMTIEREHNTNTQSKATADETIKIGQEMNDEQKMTNKPDAIETQMMDREHDTTIQSKATADEPITICPKVEIELLMLESEINLASLEERIWLSMYATFDPSILY